MIEPFKNGTSGRVFAIHAVGNDIYVGGSFLTPSSCIAKWNGTWNALKTGLSSNVYAITTYKSELYIGGSFVDAGLVANYITRWDGKNWFRLQGYNPDEDVLAMAVFREELWVGGKFSSIGGIAGTKGIARFTDSGWLPVLGNGLAGTVPFVGCISVFSDFSMFIGGLFEGVGGLTTNGIAKWDGNVWSSLKQGAYGRVTSIVQFQNLIFVGGFFAQVGNDVDADNIAAWDGSNWRPIGNGTAGIVTSMLVFDNVLYVSGDFTSVGNHYNEGINQTQYLARWSGSTWFSMDFNATGNADAMIPFNNTIYLGGDFTNYGGVYGTNRIAKMKPCPIPPSPPPPPPPTPQPTPSTSDTTATSGSVS